MTEPYPFSTPWAAVRERVRETVFLGDRTFRLDRPGGSDHLLDHPAVRATFAATGYMPYWADLWPAARMLAKAVLREPWPSDGNLAAVEVGCGLGLAGIAALSRGLRVTFSDCDELAVTFAAGNARLNGFTEFATAVVDLRAPPPGMTYPIILGSDLLYEAAMVDPLVRFLDAVLVPGGLALIADPDRPSARTFCREAADAGLVVVPVFARAGEPGGERTKGTIYRITKPVL